MADHYLLSGEDRAWIQRLINESVDRTAGLKDHSGPPDRVSDAPETYVALTPSTGIPALNRSGTTGTDTPDPDALDDVPGSAQCNVYRCYSVLGVRRLRRVGQLKRTVLNLGPLALAGNVFVLITRDKFGTWYALGPMGIEVAGC